MQCSVIIPVYNRADLIKFTLNSLDAGFHSGVNLEIIVVDDGSTDNVIEVVKTQYPHVIVMANKGKGASSARNEGLAVATGKYVVYLDSDDLIGPEFLKAKIDFLQQNDEVGAVYGKYEYFDSEGDFVEKDIIFKHKYPVIKSLNATAEHITNYFGGNYIPQNAIVWKREVLVDLGGHDSKLLVNQDVELVIRALLNGTKIMGIDDDTHAYIRHHSSDVRVGLVANSIPKLQNILDLRRRLFSEFVKSEYCNDRSLKSLSTYLFNFWRSTRHFDKELANSFLSLSKEIYWPIKIKGNLFFRTLGSLLGPVNAVEIKYFLLKRD